MPIDPPYAGRVAGPMTRTVADAALMMRELSQPDERDTMSLPAQDIDWLRSRRATPAGLRIGLLLDAGCRPARSSRRSRPRSKPAARSASRPPAPIVEPSRRS